VYNSETILVEEFIHVQFVDKKPENDKLELVEDFTDLLKDNFKLHESANQVCNVQDEEERVETKKLCILFM